MELLNDKFYIPFDKSIIEDESLCDCWLNNEICKCENED